MLERAPQGHEHASASDLIGGVFAPRLEQALPAFGAGLPACVAVDQRTGRADAMALLVRRDWPARANAIAALVPTSIPGLLTPLAHGRLRRPGAADYAVVCRQPDGDPLGSASVIHRRWEAAELLAVVLRPVAGVLAALQARRLTHRAIRPDNLFQSLADQPVTLGAAWAAPPALLQPAVFEPPYVAMCLPAGRGDGGIADDVYALGVVLIALVTGRIPMEGLDEMEVVRRKLDFGSFAAITAELRLPPAIADLVRGMLAEDPDHRPEPARLQDPDSLRGRRLATPPPRSGQRPIDIAGRPVWRVRALAGALATAPGPAARALRGGVVGQWLRRSLSDAALAGRLDEAVRLRDMDGDPDEAVADALLVTRAVALLDPLAPLCWRGLAVWPDGLGPALLASTQGQVTDLVGMVQASAVSTWCAARGEAAGSAMMLAMADEWRALLRKRGWTGGLPALRSLLNPLGPCASPVLAGHAVVAAHDLLPALEAWARGDPAVPLPIDREMAAFLTTRSEQRMDRDLAALAEAAPREAARMHLRILARLQRKAPAMALPSLAAWLLDRTRPFLDEFRGQARRRDIETALAGHAERGWLVGLAEVLDDPATRDQDFRDEQVAQAALLRIDAALSSLEAQRASRADQARRVGGEIAGALGIVAVSGMIVALTL